LIKKHDFLALGITKQMKLMFQVLIKSQSPLEKRERGIHKTERG
jgi:hypothetical protein